MLTIGKKFEREDAKVYRIYTAPETGDVLGACWDGETPPFIADAEATGKPVAAHDSTAVGLRRLLGADQRAISDLMIVHGRKGGARTKIGSVIREKILRSVVYLDGPIVDAQGRPITQIDGNNIGVFPAGFLNAISKAIGELNRENEEEGDGDLGE